MNATRFPQLVVRFLGANGLTIYTIQILLVVSLTGCSVQLLTPTPTPTGKPTSAPTSTPTSSPTDTPTQPPTLTPTMMPTETPTSNQTKTTAIALTLETSQTSTLYVPNDYDSIQKAIDAADDGDTIIVSPGEYIENIDFKGRSITLTSEDPENSDIVYPEES